MKRFTFLLVIFVTAVSMPINLDSILKISHIPNTTQFPTLLPFMHTIENNVLESFCIKRLEKAFNSFLEDPTMGRILLFSGKRVNELGDYEECGKKSKSEYHLFVGLGGVVRTGVGICLPIECDSEVVTKLKPQIATILSSLTKRKVKPDEVLTQETKLKNKDLNEIKLGYVIFFSVIGLILLVTAISTIVDMANLTDSKALTFKILGCFSLQKNIRGLMNIENRFDKNLEILNGIRVLSIAWVILGHSVLLTLFVPVFNLDDIGHYVSRSFTLGIVKTGTISVDIFFFLSGFLASLSIYRGFNNPKNITIKNILLSYFHRFVRLLPLVLLVVAYTIYVQPTLYDSPVSNTTEIAKKQCEKQWYQVLLYYNNFGKQLNDACIPWAWYLQNDMQLYIITPFLIILYCKNKKLGLLIMSLIFMTSIVIAAAVCVYYDFNLSYVKPNPDYDAGEYVHIKPYYRLPCYFIGMMLFFLYNEGKNPNSPMRVIATLQAFVKNNQIIFYFSGLFILCIITYSFYFLDRYPDSWGKAFGVLHMILCRPIFITGLVMIIYPVLIGKGKLLLAVLGHYIFNPLGKLTYGVYMMHIPVLYLVCCSCFQGVYFTLFDAFVSALRTLFLTYCISFVATILLESPVVQLLKQLFEGQKNPSKPKIESGK